MKLTCAERRVLKALTEYFAKHGHMPTAKQVNHELCWTSRSSLTRILQQLKGKGVIGFHPRALPVTLC